MDSIKFYATNAPYGNFSNFSSFPIYCDGEIWKTVEHFFQASKFTDFELIDQIRNYSSPMEAANEGRKKSNKLRENWEIIKDDIMYKAVKCKFFQHPSLKKELMLTGNKTIIEDTSSDYYWGDGKDGSGQNKLGSILMQIRTELFEISTDENLVLPPWIAFSKLTPDDMFWRMGIGENYIDVWANFFEHTENKIRYKLLFKTNEEWDYLYSDY